MPDCTSGPFVGLQYIDYGPYTGAIPGGPTDMSPPPTPDASNETWYYISAPSVDAICNVQWHGYTQRLSNNNPAVCHVNPDGTSYVTGDPTTATPPCNAFNGTGSSGAWTAQAGDHVYGVGANFVDGMSAATIPTAPTGYALTTTTTTATGPDDTFTPKLVSYFTPHVLIPSLLLIACLIAATLVSSWGRKAARRG